MTEQPQRRRMRDTLDGRKRWYYAGWWIERVEGAYEAHPSYPRKAHVNKFAGRTLVEVELKISKAERMRVLEGGAP